MSQKKDTPKRAKKSRAELRKELARNVAAILANPETPSNLYNAVGEATTEWTNSLLDAESDGAAFLENTLNAYLAKEEKRKGGVK